jgi:hypothetical protein
MNHDRCISLFNLTGIPDAYLLTHFCQAVDMS